MRTLFSFLTTNQWSLLLIDVSISKLNFIPNRVVAGLVGEPGDSRSLGAGESYILVVLGYVQTGMATSAFLYFV